MGADPPKADLPKRKRRWFQFSLRTLLIGVTLLAVACAYLAHQARIVNDRKAMMQTLAHEGGRVLSAAESAEHMASQPEPRLNWIRQLLGDEYVCGLYIPPTTPEPVAAKIKAAFPELGAIVSDGPFIDYNNLVPRPAKRP
jgi:hypothetical protein